MPGYWHAHSDRDWENDCGNPLPARPQYPLSYPWHLGPTYDDREALEARADVVETEMEEIGRRITIADNGNDWCEYDRLEEEHDLACRELVLLRKRLDDLGVE